MEIEKSRAQYDTVNRTLNLTDGQFNQKTLAALARDR